MLIFDNVFYNQANFWVKSIGQSIWQRWIRSEPDIQMIMTFANKKNIYPCLDVKPFNTKDLLQHL